MQRLQQTLDRALTPSGEVAVLAATAPLVFDGGEVGAAASADIHGAHTARRNLGDTASTEPESDLLDHHRHAHLANRLNDLFNAIEPAAEVAVTFRHDQLLGWIHMDLQGVGI